jgi:hypothetical protein
MNIDSFITFIKENFVPNGIVFSTEKAKKIIAKNNLTPAQFLRPFGIFPKVEFNTETSTTIISDFRLDFYDSEYYKKIPYVEYSKIIEKVLSSKNISPEIPKFDSNSIVDEKNTKISDKIINKLNGLSFPWFNLYIKTICELIRFNECELYQQPLCFIYFCALDDDINTIKPQLNEKDKIPSLIYERIYEPDMPILIIIINDKSSEKQISTEEKNKYIDAYKEKYKVYYLLYWELNEVSNTNINDLNETTIKYYSGDLWSKYEHITEKYYYNANKENNSKDGIDEQNSNIKGKYINIFSRRRFHQTINDFFVKYAVKHIEHKVRAIEKKIIETKKGLKNAIFGFFKQDTQNISWNNFYKIYSLATNEFQEYFFAIISFYFKNYKQAKETASFFMNDIKKKSTRHYNAAFELYKLSHYLNNYYSKTKTIDYNPFYKEDDAFESFSNYIKNENYFQACRALFSGIKIHEQNLTILQLASILSDAIYFIPGLPNKNGSVYVNFFCPLINEQISIYYIVLEPMKKRKFLWYMTQAAIRFRKESKLNDFLIKYCLNDFLLLNDFLDKNNENSFLITKNFITEIMGCIFQEVNNSEGAIISYVKNIQNFIHFSGNDKKNYEKNAQQIFEKMIKLLSNIKKETTEDNSSNTNNNSNILSKFSIPQIDNSSILIIEEQDTVINNSYKNENENKYTTINWKYFKKYDYIQVQKQFLCLTPPDILALVNLDNIIENKQNFSNFFSKRKFHISINKKIYVSFQMTNPLPFDININNMKLICDFYSQKELSLEVDTEKDNDTIIEKNEKNTNEEKDLIYEEKQLVLSKESSNIIELYIQGNKEGKIIIRGVEITLENYITVKHYFNEKNKTNLYNYVKKRRKSTTADFSLGVPISPNSPNTTSHFVWGRKGSNTSQNSNKSKGSNNSYKLHIKYKEEIICDIKDNNNDINILFPLGNELKLYKNELFFMPIKIINNSSNISIKNFCFYFNDDSNNVEESCLLNELIFKEFEITNEKNNKNNEKTIYVPIIPKKKGTIFIKILFKFEEEKTYIDHEIQRFLVTIDVEDTFNVNFKEIINKYQSEFIMADLDMLCIMNNSSDKQIFEKLCINQCFYSNNLFEQINKKNDNIEIKYNEDKNSKEINNEVEVLYNKYKIKKIFDDKDENNYNKFNEKQSEFTIKKRREKLHKKVNEIKKYINLDFLKKYEFLQNGSNEEQNHIKNYFCDLLGKDYLIFNWNALEKGTNREINGVFFYKPKLSFSISNNLFKNIINNFITMKHEMIKVDNCFTLCIISVSIDNNFYKQINNIKGIEIYINNKDKNNFKKYKWIGLKRYFLSNLKNDSGKIDEIQFTCQINEKGLYDMNQISLAIHYIISKEGVQIFDNILSPIIVNVN